MRCSDSCKVHSCSNSSSEKQTKVAIVMTEGVMVGKGTVITGGN